MLLKAATTNYISVKAFVTQTYISALIDINADFFVISIFRTDATKSYSNLTRNCNFQGERILQYYSTYSRYELKDRNKRRPHELAKTRLLLFKKVKLIF